MASLANQDFGSESEDDDFNPAPAIDSDDEADVKPSTERKSRKSSSEPASRAVREEDYDDEEDEKPSVTNGTEDKADINGDRDEEADGEADADGDEDDAGGEDVDDEDDEDDDNDDDDEEDDIQGGHRRKRRKRDPRNQFIDVEAEVDDEDEDVDEDEEGEAVGDFLADTHPDDLNDLPPGADKDDRRHRELDRQRELQASLDAEKQAALLKERYGRNRAAATDAAIMPQRLLLPSVDDPTIWGVRCKPGKEKEIVFNIMKRIEDRINTREPLAITSAFERGGTMAGYIYVEARKQSDVMTACDGVTFLYPRTKMVLIPIGEMPDLLRVHKSKQLEPGAYVRIKRGKYQGDLAQVEDVETNGLDVSVRLVPRLDYGQNEDANASPEKRKRPGFGGGNPAANRPPPRLFSEQEAKRKHGKFLQQVVHLGKKQFTYLNDTYIDGFLIKDVKLQHLITEDVNPTLEEVTRFAAREEDGVENLDLTALAATLKAAGANAEYLPGDMVEVYQGEQRGVTGKAISVHGDIVKLMVTEGDLQGQVIEAPVKGLRKKFNEGDHVKVVGASKYHDEVGMIVKIRDDRVTLLTDSNNQEITVFSKDLREATDAGGTVGSSKYDLYDLVQLDAATVACVIKVDRESLRVLDQTGSVRSLLPSNISNKIEKRRNAVATDRDGSEIRVDDTIKEQGSFGERKQGRVLHIHRNFLFALSRTQTENAGVFVVRTANVLTVAAKGGRINNAGPDLTKMNPTRSNAQNGGAGGPPMPPPKTFGRDKLLGRTVTIRKGPHKGLLGIVKDTTDSEARVELHTKSKIVNVPKDAVLVKDPVTGQTIDSWKLGAGGAGRGKPGDMGRTPYGGRTPSTQSGWQGSAGGGGRTPMATANGGRTPAWNGAGGRTPAWTGGSGGGGSGGSGGSGWASGGRTPAAGVRGGDGGRTPAWGSAGAGDRTVNPYDGSRTAYGGGGSGATWSSSSRTPYSSSAGFSGSRTPAWQPSSTSTSTANFDSGSRTPAHNPYASAPTPSWGTSTSSHPTPSSTAPGKPYDAPTPAPAYSAPTPGAYGAPTPSGGGAYVASTPGANGGGSGGGYSAPTPGPYTGAPTPGAGQTPGMWAAETPGVGGGEEEDPRYE
ncbi:MAG: transcription elongation factor spt5 [Bathelium mastoideum]|nr:MAG: transcription elongation factor spt5 [Bathelium mastoideum]